MNTMRTLPAALSALSLAALVGCATQQPDPMEAMEEYEQDVAADGGGEPAPTTAELGGTLDLGGGVTLAMVDLRREIAEDGFNATTGEEGALPYVAWSWELTNNSGQALPLGGTTTSCHVGDPLAEAAQPHLGDSLNPPDMLADGQTAAWSGDCWMGEDESALQYTLELYTPDSELMYTATFAGDVPA